MQINKMIRLCVEKSHVVYWYISVIFDLSAIYCTM